MRHGKKFNHLNRTKSHRRALLSNLAKALIQHKSIITTLAKAKALRSYIEPLVSKAKKRDTHQERLVFSYFQDKTPVKELFQEIGPRLANRPGGYTRIVKLDTRLGDRAQQCIIEFVDYYPWRTGVSSTPTL